MTQFSANLGFLWSELPLPDAIRAAKKAGFHAVECHWPYDTPVELVNAALTETGMQMLGLNTRRGDLEKKENGLCALPGREADARAVIDEAVAYARQIQAQNVHVMAGFSSGHEAHEVFKQNLMYACKLVENDPINILIEPLNKFDAPGYFLSNSSQAQQIINEVGHPKLKLMFDCYHLQIMEGNLCASIKELLPIIGHVQFASVPDRGAPDCGEINYSFIFNYLQQLNYTTPLGAEYKPSSSTESSLAWLNNI